uniref:Aspartylglucosaminidase n=1 Tax=Pavo cristatus TaxID=9049 RepID=A0A8C9FJG0_PAVCR
KTIFSGDLELFVLITAWRTLQLGGSELDAVEKGCGQCEIDQCDGSVGYGGSPDESGETTLDAMIMDGHVMKFKKTKGCLQRPKKALIISVFKVFFCFVVVFKASLFAVRMGFPYEDLTTQRSLSMYSRWLNQSCQPNYWKNVVPDSSKSCGPYKRLEKVSFEEETISQRNVHSHDTIGNNFLVALKFQFSFVEYFFFIVHCSRVGDSPIAGAGSYADSTAGGAAATGDGDTMMRFLPRFVLRADFCHCKKIIAVIVASQKESFMVAYAKHNEHWCFMESKAVAFTLLKYCF